MTRFSAAALLVLFASTARANWWPNASSDTHGFYGGDRLVDYGGCTWDASYSTGWDGISPEYNHWDVQNNSNILLLWEINDQPYIAYVNGDIFAYDTGDSCGYVQTDSVTNTMLIGSLASRAGDPGVRIFYDTDGDAHIVDSNGEYDGTDSDRALRAADDPSELIEIQPPFYLVDDGIDVMLRTWNETTSTWDVGSDHPTGDVAFAIGAYTWTSAGDCYVINPSSGIWNRTADHDIDDTT